MGDEKETIVPTNEPVKAVDDRTLAVADELRKTTDSESTAGVPKGEEGAEPTKKKRSRKVYCLWCCVLLVVIIVLLVVIIVILIFTVFKVKTPTIHVTTTTLQNVRVASPMSIEAQINITAYVYNPNVVGLRHGNTTALFFYRGEQISEVPVAAGRINPKKNETIFLPLALSLSSKQYGNLTRDINNHEIPLFSQINVKGKITFGAIKIKGVHISSSCNINYFISNKTESFNCQFKIKK